MALKTKWAALARAREPRGGSLKNFSDILFSNWQI
jgi:hypothetical protein